MKSVAALLIASFLIFTAKAQAPYQGKNITVIGSGAGNLLLEGTTASDQTTIEAWGDSHTAGAGQTPWTTTLASLTGLTVNNNGVGGETSTQVKARFDAASAAKKARPTIIWVGFNDYSSDNTYVAAKANIAAMVAALGHSSYLIIGEIMSKNGGFESGVTGWINKMAFNRYLAATYGQHFFDAHAFIVSLYDKTNATDLIDYFNDVEPSTTLIDAQHVTSAVNALIAGELNRRKKDFGIGTTVLNRTGLYEATLAPINIGGVKKSPAQFGYLEANTINIDEFSAIKQAGLPIIKYNTASRSIMIGQDAGKASRTTTTTQTQNVFIGFQAGQNATPTQFQALTGIGYNALSGNTSGLRNTAIGQTALFSNTVGNNNTAIGNSALINSDAYNNTAIGYNAGQNITSGGQNVVIGSLVDATSPTASGQVNIANVILGQGATGTGTTKQGTIGIGTDAKTNARIALPAGTTTIAPLNIPTGVAPTTPQNGDIWVEGTDIKIRLAGVTYTLMKS